jgi:hypothetical protein
METTRPRPCILVVRGYTRTLAPPYKEHAKGENPNSSPPVLRKGEKEGKEEGDGTGAAAARPSCPCATAPLLLALRRPSTSRLHRA